MKNSRKIGLIAIPVIILIVMVLFPFSSKDTVSVPSLNELEIPGIENSSIDLSSFNSPIIGSSSAPVTIIAFNDYQCKSCKTWYQSEYPVIFKNLIETQKANIMFIDSATVENDSILISEATFCANEQEKYSEYQEVLFSSQQQIDVGVNSEQLKQFAIDLDMNQELFEECLDSEKYKTTVLTNIEFSKNFGVVKIPLFKIVNFEGKEHLLKGGISSSIFEEVVNRFQ